MRAQLGVSLAVLLLFGCRSPAPEGPRIHDDDVRVVDFPSQTVLALSRTGAYSDMGKAMNGLVAYMKKHQIEPAGSMTGVFYDDPSTTAPTKTRYEIRFPVPPGTTATPPFVVKKTPPMKTATVELTGPYEAIAKLYPQLFAWVARHGYVVAGPLTEVFIVHPGSGVPPNQYVTDVHVPVMAP